MILKVQKSIVWCKRSIADYIFILAHTDCYTSVKKNCWVFTSKGITRRKQKMTLFWDESLLICCWYSVWQDLNQVNVGKVKRTNDSSFDDWWYESFRYQLHIITSMSLKQREKASKKFTLCEQLIKTLYKRKQEGNAQMSHKKLW